MIRRVFWAGILAGLAAGTLVTIIQQLKLTPLIIAAEGLPPVGGHDHPHDHADSGWAPAEGAERLAFTWLANLLLGSGFGLLLTAAFALRDSYAGELIDLGKGVAWGIAGFAVFALAPALQLPPELPGMAAADLGARQVWWIATALFTAIGIALLAFGRSGFLKCSGIVALVVPHAAGVLSPADHLPGSVPAELAAAFAAASLASAAVFWVCLGAVSGWLYGRLARA